MLDFQKSGFDLDRLISEAAESDVRDWCRVEVASRAVIRHTQYQDLAELLTGMAANFGISADSLISDEEQFRDLLSVCRMCGERDSCREAASLTNASVMEDCGFCPNWISLLDLSPVVA
jgi:hypothetical protein